MVPLKVRVRVKVGVMVFFDDKNFADLKKLSLTLLFSSTENSPEEGDVYENILIGLQKIKSSNRGLL